MPDMIALDIGAVAFSGYDPDGFLVVQYDAEGEDQAAVAPYEAHHPLGFIARPLDPVLDHNGQADPTQSCTVLFGTRGGVGLAVPLEDVRVVPLLPALQKGESMQYGPAWGQFCRMHTDGSISLTTATKTATDGTGQPVWLRVTPTALKFVAPWGMLLFDATGFHVKTAGGVRLDLGTVAGMPAPLNNMSRMFSVQADVASIDASIVAAGPSAGASGGAPALANPLLTLLGSLMAYLQTVQAALSSAVPNSGITPAQTGAALTAFTQLQAALITAQTAIPSQSTAT